ncbi:MAG TPA: hypothetical protein VFA74_18180 [Terriglobales bacterium]|nr:hypothetical protein [Terriglobales bacterium]
MEQTAGTGPDAELYSNMEGAQTGGNRARRNAPNTAGNLNTEPAVAAFEGSTSTRTPGGTGQGISSQSANEESSWQEKVVKERPDAQAGVNQNRKS